MNVSHHCPCSSTVLTHWGRVTHICISKLTIIGSDNGLSPDWRQAIIWTNAGLLLIGPLGTNFREILIKILTFSFKKMRLKVSFAKWWPFCLGLNVLIICWEQTWNWKLVPSYWLSHQSKQSCCLNSIGNTIVAIRQSYNCLILLVGFLLVKQHPYVWNLDPGHHDDM